MEKGRRRTVEVTDAELESYGIARKYHTLNLRRYKCDVVVKKNITKYIKNFMSYIDKGKGVYITNKDESAGVCGKSQLLNMLALAAVAHALEVEVVTLGRLTEARFNPEQKLDWNTFLGRHCLFIDELYYVIPSLDKNYAANDGMKVALYECVKYRVAHKLPTFFATRLSLDMLEEKFGESVRTHVENNSIVIECSKNRSVKT